MLDPAAFWRRLFSCWQTKAALDATCFREKERSERFSTRLCERSGVGEEPCIGRPMVVSHGARVLAIAIQEWDRSCWEGKKEVAKRERRLGSGIAQLTLDFPGKSTRFQVHKGSIEWDGKARKKVSERKREVFVAFSKLSQLLLSKEAYSFAALEVGWEAPHKDPESAPRCQTC